MIIHLKQSKRWLTVKTQSVINRSYVQYNAKQLSATQLVLSTLHRQTFVTLQQYVLRVQLE